MSYEDGWAAINLEMPKRIPRTEYSASGHWELVKAVTGIDVSADSPPELQQRASAAFIRAWNYDFIWSAHMSHGEFGELLTNMGHAVYAAGGVDYDDNIQCPFSDPEEVLNFDPWERLGERDKRELIRRFEEYYKKGRESFPDAVNTTGIYITMISAFTALFGWDLQLMAAGIDPKGFGDMANRYAGWIQQYFDALAETSIPLVLIHDDIVWSSGPIYNPAWYREYVFPNYRKYFAPLLAGGKKILFCSDGNFDEFVDDIADAGVHGFIFEPMTSLEAIAAKYGKTHVIIGNADTRVLLTGTKERIRAEVERCMSAGRECPGFFLAVGNHIPPNTPVENALYYNECYEKLSRR